MSNVHVIHFKKKVLHSQQKKIKITQPQLKKKTLGSKPGPPRNQMGRPLHHRPLHYKQGNQRWQIPRLAHASAWQRSPH